MKAFCLKILRKIFNSVPGKLALPIAYALLSAWLPSHFSVTACSNALITCMIEEFTVFWELNRLGSAGNLLLRILQEFGWDPFAFNQNLMTIIGGEEEQNPSQ